MNLANQDPAFLIYVFLILVKIAWNSSFSAMLWLLRMLAPPCMGDLSSLVQVLSPHVWVLLWVQPAWLQWEKKKKSLLLFPKPSCTCIVMEWSFLYCSHLKKKKMKHWFHFITCMIIIGDHSVFVGFYIPSVLFKVCRCLWTTKSVIFYMHSFVQLDEDNEIGGLNSWMRTDTYFFISIQKKVKKKQRTRQWHHSI